MTYSSLPISDIRNEYRVSIRSDWMWQDDSSCSVRQTTGSKLSCHFEYIFSIKSKRTNTMYVVVKYLPRLDRSSFNFRYIAIEKSLRSDRLYDPWLNTKNYTIVGIVTTRCGDLSFFTDTYFTSLRTVFSSADEVDNDILSKCTDRVIWWK